MYCQQGKHSKANTYLLVLGYRYKLSKHVWNALKETGTHSGHSIDSTGIVASYENILPPHMLHQLKNAVCPSSMYWTAHNYPTSQFFSYNVPLHRKKKTGKNIPSHNLIREIAKYVLPHISSSFPNVDIADITSVEFWAHSRCEGSGTGHRLHYDLDETALNVHKELRHPLVSCVLYIDELSESSVPTLITNQVRVALYL